ncbi:hypothetical protein AgCh_032396 [Apium graveolens]
MPFNEHPVIIIIHSAKVVRNEYSGAFSLSTMAAMSFDLNSNCARVDVLRFGMSMVFKWVEDVVGIIKQYEPLATLVNKHGDAQRQVKLVITDGKSSINVTFWDACAENFDQEMNELKEKTAILIIASSRVGLWNGEVDLSSVGGTQYYLNYNHYSVVQLRRKLDLVGFKEQMYAADRHGKVELLSAAIIKELGPEYIMIISAHFLYMYKVIVVASDETGAIELLLGDLQIRTLLGIRAVQLLQQSTGEEDFPLVFKSVTKQKYTVKLLIKEINVVNKATIYWVTNICKSFIDPNSHL